MTSNHVLQLARYAAACALFFFSVAQAKEEKVYTAPPIVHARTCAAHQEDPQDKVTIAVDAYDGPPKSDIFTVEYQKYGLLPVQLIISNDGDDAISLKGLKVELETGRKAKLEALREDEVIERLFRHGQVRPHVQGPSPLPIPLPTKSRTSAAEKAHKAPNPPPFPTLPSDQPTTPPAS